MSSQIAKVDQDQSKLVRLPEWLKREAGSSKAAHPLKTILREHKLNTVCEEARCPNISECFSKGTATFMILGDVCTRGCRFCSVVTGKPLMPESDFELEADRVLEAVRLMKLKYVVVTSVARDDLKDGGASGFVKTIRKLKENLSGVKVEVLIPDLRGNWDALKEIVEAEPDVLNHNVETVPRLYRRVRPGATLERSLELLDMSKKFSSKIKTKTGLMLGLGETIEEVIDVMKESSKVSIDIFTAGQYMQPTRDHLPVQKYLSPLEFEELESIARSNNFFREVYMGPLVRSSYHAGEVASKIS